MVGEYDYFVAARLQADGGIDHEALGAADAEIGVEEDDGAERRCAQGVEGHEQLV